jgi:hypothetical protein
LAASGGRQIDGAGRASSQAIVPAPDAASLRELRGEIRARIVSEHRMDAYRKVSGMIFAIVAIAHGVRAIAGWSAVVDGTSIPIWVSWGVVAGAGLLSLWALGGRK